MISVTKFCSHIKKRRPSACIVFKTSGRVRMGGKDSPIWNRVKDDQMNVYYVHQGSYSGLCINLGLQGRSLRQKVYFLFNIEYENQPVHVTLVLTKVKNIKGVENMCSKRMNIIIRGKYTKL